ncbi:uncharacterized protein HGUI_03754 [Hanseniaspora guilliermondii]|uniref:P-type ATPase A domain-containing protein n=1 Tax=Hanseniaspora guilliermondii TaxID=56406 RepID=A0A1L0CSH0_9ASCO|nr:uncharacterized protein HGUI_03754 [Hanseniaspora guilliermondii]
MNHISLKFSVKGMTCGACVSNIEKQVDYALKTQIITKYHHINNFVSVISLVTEECHITFDSNLSAQEVDEITSVFNETIEDAGFDCLFISKDIKTNSLRYNLLFKVGGMTCGACSSTITEQVTVLLNDLESQQLILKANDVPENKCHVSLVTEECKVICNLLNTDNVDIIKERVIECIENCGFDCAFLSFKADISDKNMNLIKSNDLIRTVEYELCTSSDDFDENNLKNFLESKDNIQKVVIESVSNETSKTSIVDFCQTYSLSVTYKITPDTNIRTIMNDITSNYDVDAFPQIGSSNDVQNQQLESLNRTKEINFWKHNFVVSGIIALSCMTMYMCIPMFILKAESPNVGPYKLINNRYFKISIVNLIGLTIASYLQFGPLGSHFWKAFKKSLRNYSGTMDTLVSISTLCAYTFSVYSILNVILYDGRSQILFDTSTMLFCFISFGKYLENKARARTSFVLSKIMTMSPITALLYNEKTQKSCEIQTSMIELNDILEIKPGSKIPCDGIVVDGVSEIDEQIITGESTPILKRQNDKLAHGSVNGHNRFLMRVEKAGNDTSLLKLLDILKNAQLSKAPMQELADRLAARFVPFVVLLSLLTFVFWSFYCKYKGAPSAFRKMSPVESNAGQDSSETYMAPQNYFFDIFKVAVSVVIVACPCALGLAAPTSVIVGTGLAAEHGILMKNGEILQNLQNIDCFVMDKTGTLTLGKLVVNSFDYYSNRQILKENLLSKDDVLNMVDLLESVSEHAVATCLVKYCKEAKSSSEKKNKFTLLEVENKVGQGVYGNIKDKDSGKVYSVVIGNKKILSQDCLKYLETQKINERVGSISFITINNQLVGEFILNDLLKADSKDVVYYLRYILNKEVYMCTGDNTECALDFADQLELPHDYVRSEMTPTSKYDFITELQNQDKKVAFVGDGINDSLALTQADLGVSIVNDGLDIVMGSSDVVIMNNKTLIQIIHCIEIANRTFTKIKSNFFWSLIYNTFMLPVAMGLLIPFNITLNPIIAGGAMALSSVSVVLNSLLIRNWEPKVIQGISTDQNMTIQNRGSFERLFVWAKNKTNVNVITSKYAHLNGSQERLYEMV